MLEKFLRFFFTMFFAVAGSALLNLASPVFTLFISTEVLRVDMGIFKLTAASLLCILIGAILGGLIGFFISPFLTRRIKRLAEWTERQLAKMPISDVIAGAVGLAIGLILANLLSYSIAKIPVVGDYIPVIVSIVFGYLGIYITIRKREELTSTFSFLPRLARELARLRETRTNGSASDKAEKPMVGATAVREAPVKLLDTSAIIDGRIADVLKTGFLEGTLVTPVFVLEELQHIADSPNPLKRTRGRRGLDILAHIRRDKLCKVVIESKDFEDIQEVDSKLVALAREMGGKILTTDFNLNKVAQLRGVEVLNINELANAVKPVVIPGEKMEVAVVKPGKEAGQGLAYLDDGTMIVVEDGSRYMNETIVVEVTSALQTAAGRMIFAKPV